jgi:hypothetical protein
MRHLLTNTIVPALRHLLWIPVAALLVADARHQNPYGFPPRVYRQFKYGDTWMRVELFTGRTTVLIAPKGWVTVKGIYLPPPEAGRGAVPLGAPVTSRDFK